MGIFIIAGDNAKNYPTRLKKLERRMKVLEIMLVLPWIVNTIIDVLEWAHRKWIIRRVTKLRAVEEAIRAASHPKETSQS